MKEKLENAIKHFLEKENATKEEYGRLTIITYQEKYLVIFKNSYKPLYHLAFKFGIGIGDFIKKVKKQEDEEIEAQNKYLNKKKEEKKLFVQVQFFTVRGDMNRQILTSMKLLKERMILLSFRKSDK